MVKKKICFWSKSLYFVIKATLEKRFIYVAHHEQLIFVCLTVVSGITTFIFNNAFFLSVSDSDSDNTVGSLYFGGYYGTQVVSEVAESLANTSTWSPGQVERSRYNTSTQYEPEAKTIQELLQQVCTATVYKSMI